MSTIAELQALNYRQLQAECKNQGISAKGKSEELLGKLILNLQKQTPGASTPASTPQPAKKSAGRKPAAAAPTPAAPSPSPRKSLDKKTVQRALSTPLPPSPARPRATPAAAAPRREQPDRLAATMAAILAVLIAVLLYAPMINHYCSHNDCDARLEAAFFRGLDAVAGARSRVEVAAVAAAEHARWATRQAASKLHELVDTVQGGPPAVPPAFNGHLNTAVLSSVLRADGGAAWEELRLSLGEAWTGGKIAADASKANVVLFACGSPGACSAAAGELSAAAPVDATLVLGPVDVAAGPGAVQARLVAHLASHPRGVVVVPAVDRVPLAVIPVLSNAMGEYGALTADGHGVSTSGATFLLTWQAPAAVMAEDSETSFSLAAKRDLTLLLRGEAAGEATQAAVDAFRRRIDLVVPVADAPVAEE